MDIAVLSNVNLDILNQQLGSRHHVFETQGYGQWSYYCFDPDGSLQGFHPQVIFLLLEGNALVENCRDLCEGRKELEGALMQVQRLLERFSDISVFVSSIDICQNRIMADTEERFEASLCAEWRKKISALQGQYKNCYLFELQDIICRRGRKEFYSAKMWYLGSIPYSYQGMELLEKEILSALEHIAATPKKVLVLDLDNTLWGGVAEEEGALGITLGNSLLGAVYQDAQKRIREIKDSGALLAVVSKNNQEIIEEVFQKNSSMILKKEDFTKICLSWEEKSAVIAGLAKELNLGLDSFVFLDDNPVEREGVKIALPEVTVADFPEDVAELPEYIFGLYQKYFWKHSLTEEDRKKTQQYRQEMEREAQKSSFHSMEEYIRSLDIHVAIQRYSDEYAERTVQLTNKTNQFNTNTVRMDLQELTEYLKMPGREVYMVFVRDRFGDSGMVSLIFTHRNGQSAEIDNFLMSCRVMGRRIEEAVVAAVEQQLYRQGITKVYASYCATAKNKPVCDLWDRLGYEKIDGEADTEKVFYEKKLKSHRDIALMEVQMMENGR